MKYAIMLLLLTGCKSHEMHNLFTYEVLTEEEWNAYIEPHKCHIGMVSKFFWQCEEPAPEVWVDSRVNL